MQILETFGLDEEKKNKMQEAAHATQNGYEVIAKDFDQQSVSLISDVIGACKRISLMNFQIFFKN